ncbi:MAG: hypothetical protein FK734_07520 [Asgard group archaeon]|nr:hypothetical protein [Asgard group archaeon]
MKKSELFSLITNPIRNSIITRLAKIDKTAYSDILDSVNLILPLTSTGNFNYHLNFLIEHGIVEKNGMVYKLTTVGKEIARFVNTVNQKWLVLEKNIRGDIVSIFSLAEHFEKETNITMEKNIIDFHGSEMIMDEQRNIGILEDYSKIDFFKNYHQLNIEDFELFKLQQEQIEVKDKISTLLKHPHLEYYLSPKLLGIIQEYLEKNFGEVTISATKDYPAPFLITTNIDTKKCAFVIAPAFIDKELKKKIPRKE